MTLQATLATWLVEPSENEIVQKYEELQESNGWAQGPSEWKPMQLHSLSLKSAQFSALTTVLESMVGSVIKVKDMGEGVCVRRVNWDLFGCIDSEVPRGLSHLSGMSV